MARCACCNQILFDGNLEALALTPEENSKLTDLMLIEILKLGNDPTYKVLPTLELLAKVRPTPNPRAAICSDEPDADNPFLRMAEAGSPLPSHFSPFNNEPDSSNEEDPFDGGCPADCLPHPHPAD